MVNSKKEMIFYSKMGFNIIAVGTEMSLLRGSILNLLKN